MTFRLLFAIMLVCGVARAIAGCQSLTPAEQATVAKDQVQIEICKQKGRDCKADKDGGDCFAVYDSCMQDGGLR